MTMMMLLHIILLILYINQCNSYNKPSNVGNDKIKYFNKVIRVAHPTTMHPHVTLLFRIKIG